MNKKVFVLVALIMCVISVGLFAQSASAENADGQAIEQVDNSKSFKYVAAALAVGLACIAGGMAVGKIGAAAMGALSENAELSGKALPFVGLAEGICLWGFIIAFLLVM